MVVLFLLAANILLVQTDFVRYIANILKPNFKNNLFYYNFWIMFCNYFVRMESSKTARCFFAMVVKIINPDPVAMNKYYYSGKTG